jgi:hypothetical protein
MLAMEEAAPAETGEMEIEMAETGVVVMAGTMLAEEACR